MTSNKLNLFKWIQSKTSVELYQEWKNNPTTDLMIRGLYSLLETRLVAPSAVDGKIDPLEAVQLNAHRAGRESILTILNNLDDFVNTTTSGDDESHNEDLVSYLMETERFTREQAVKLIETQTGEL